MRTRSLLISTLVLALAVIAVAADNHDGTWKLSVAACLLQFP
jgi:hypothetical protein